MISELSAPGSFNNFDELEAAVAALPSVAIETHHHFAPGLYAREIRIPAGTMLTGKLHKTCHLNIISAGRIAVVTANGGSRLVVAPETFVSEPGTRRAGFALEDTVWTTIHPTQETDLAKIEAEVIEPYTNPLLADSGRKIT